MAEKHLYEIKHIETSFRTDGKMFKAIEDVSLYLNPGEIIGIVGESGSGKSVTMMSALQLIQEPGKVTGGEVYLDGNDKNMLEYMHYETVWFAMSHLLERIEENM